MLLPALIVPLTSLRPRCDALVAVGALATDAWAWAVAGAVGRAAPIGGVTRVLRALVCVVIVLWHHGGIAVLRMHHLRSARRSRECLAASVGTCWLT